MKIAYLMFSDHYYYDIVPVLKELVRQGDHCFIMVNDEKTRDSVTIAFGDDPRVHVSHTQEFAQEGDMSLARGTLIQMKEALEYEDAHFDYYINLTTGMLPVKTRTEIVKFLEDNPGDYYYVDHTEKDDPKLRKNTLKYYTFTNVLTFPDSKHVKNRTKRWAAFLNLLHIRRKLDDFMSIGSPWFIFTPATAQVLADNYPYCSDAFKLSWYAEEMCYSMMINKFMPGHEHINKDLRVVGPDGHWVEGQGARELKKDVLEAHPEALFGGKVYDDEDDEDVHAFYEEVLKTYNSDYTGGEIGKKNPREYNEAQFNQLVDELGEARKNRDGE
jgi:hypothetical protein